MLRLPSSIGKTLVLLLGFIAIANMGCATSIAAKFPHLDRRSVCVLPSEVESDATEYVFTENNVPISNFHPEVVDRVAENARAVYEYDPDADPRNTQYLPAPYNTLECSPRFSLLPSKDTEMPALPVAAVNLLLHERRPEPVSKALADELAKCSSQISGPVNPIQHSMKVNVYVTNEGQTVFAYVADSTLGNHQLNACVVNVLRKTQWSATAKNAPNVAATPIALKGLIAQPAPAEPLPEPAPESGIRRIQPQSSPTGRVPRLFVIPINPIVAAVVVFGIIYFWLDTETPPWASEMNPITREQYTSRQEYDEVQRLSPEEIQQRRAAHIKATQSPPAPVPPPAPAPPPAPMLTPEQQREQVKMAERCAKIAKDIDDLIYTQRDKTTGDRPNGYKGLETRWSEYAENRGKWGPRPDGSPSNNMKNHLAEYVKHQTRLKKKLDEWVGCDDNDLPYLARQYAEQKPELGPGKPLEPARTPEYYPAVIPPVIVPQPKKPSK